MARAPSQHHCNQNTTMALNCDDLMLPSISKGTHGDCNPQEDSIGKNKVAIQPAPWPKETDLPPWSQLEKMKKEANEVAFHSFPPDNLKAAIAAIEGESKSCDAQTFSVDWEETPNSILVSFEDNSLLDDQGFPKISGDDSKNVRSEYTPFAKDVGTDVPSGNIAVGSTLSRENNPEGHRESTAENFDRFVEMSSMTTNILDADFIDKEKQLPTKSRWSDGIFKSQELAGASSSVLFVFDRLLDCIDPKDRQFTTPMKTFDDDDDAETDQSSAWSLSINRSWLDSLDENFSINTSDEASLFRFSLENEPDWLDESLDYMFPCWKEPERAKGEVKDSKPLRKASTFELVEAFEAGRKRKWTSKEKENNEKREPNIEGNANEEPCVNNEKNKGEILTIIQSVSSSHDDAPFDFPPPEFPPPVWKKPAPIEIEPTDTLESNATESTLSELFQGLVYGTPSDEKEGRITDLDTYLDRTSTTEDTSTLSYSDGTL